MSHSTVSAIQHAKSSGKNNEALKTRDNVWLEDIYITMSIYHCNLQWLLCFFSSDPYVESKTSG